MARRGRRTSGEGDGEVADYRYRARRLNNPPAGLVSADQAARETKRTHYAYDPHLSPQLVWAGKPGLKAIEVEDQAGIEVPDVALHVHERVSTRAILEAVQRPEPRQLGLFADPQLPLDQALKFYQHSVDWANRLILGDSLLVMNSLLTREGLRGKVQLIYLDPPYGVNYKSNFQPRIDQRDVKEDDSGLSREPEQIRAYRDTWTLGVHSYLTYLRDRLRLCRELLAESGSIFVQISDENVHRVRLLLDEDFGAENLVSLITFLKTTGATSRYLAPSADYLLWYARDIGQLKYRPVFLSKVLAGRTATAYNRVELPTGQRRNISQDELDGIHRLPAGSRVFALDNLTSQSIGRAKGEGAASWFPVTFNGAVFRPSQQVRWKTNEAGMSRLLAAGRLVPVGNTLRYVRYFNDFPLFPATSVWDDTTTAGYADPKMYVVQTNPKVITRCLLMTTDPGDLVLDPTCGSGTTAYVAEQWGRRWITCDTSRVALALARQRLLTASFPYYELADEDRGIEGGFIYKKVPHIQLSDYARNTRIEPIVERYAPLLERAEQAGEQEEVARLRQARREEIDRVVAEDSEQETLYDQPKVVRGVTRVSGPFTVEAIPPPVLELQEPTPIVGAPESLDGAAWAPETDGSPVLDDGAAHIPRLIADLARDGVTFPDNRVLRFESLTPRSGVLHAEGVVAGESDPSFGSSGPGSGQAPSFGSSGPGSGQALRTVAVSFGPLNGSVALAQVEDALYEARGGYDGVIFCGFSFQPEAQDFISRQGESRRLKAFMAHIRPDVVLTDARGESLLKTQTDSQLFAVFGEPDLELNGPDADECYSLTLHGVDVYDPLSGRVEAARTQQIAAWFVDGDYDGRAFCICQALFPNVDAWEKIGRALRGRLDEERLAALSGATSLPFKAGRHRRVAVKVIDQRGNEVMRVLGLDRADAAADPNRARA